MRLDSEAAPSLRELQCWMSGVITHPLGVESALAETRTYGYESFVSGTPELTTPERLNIYVEAYFLRLVESLEADFPVLRTVLGEDDFQYLVSSYLKKFPSTCFNIAEVGESLSEFVKTHAPEAPWLSDLTALEWAVIESFYADNHATLDAGSLGAIAPEAWPSARFVLSPSVRLLQAHYPVDLIWQEPQESVEPQPIEPVDLLLYRGPAGNVRVERVGAAARGVLSVMGRGGSLEEICAQLELKEGEELPPLMQWFADWVACGVIQSIHTGEPKCSS